MSTIAKVGQIPYLNCEPFYHGLALEGVELCAMPPSYMGPLAQAEKLDAGPFSLVQSFDLEDRYEYLGSMGISVKGPVLSILFYSRVPMEELSGALVGATRESATAVQLMKVMLEHRSGVRPREYTALDSPGLDAFLLIGDDALLTHGQVKGYPYRYDLAEEWLDWKGLPFVFAVWMARRSLDDGVKGLLADGLRGNLARNMRDNLKTIADKRAYMGMTYEEVTGYLRALRFTLDREDMEAIDVFKQVWRSLPTAKEATA